MKRRIRITPRGWFLAGAGLLLAGVAFLTARYDALFGGALALAAVGCAWLALVLTGRPGPMVRGLPEDTVPAGTTVTVSLAALDREPGPDPVVDTTEYGPATAAPAGPPGVLAYAVVPDKRGSHLLGPATVTTMAPLGLLVGTTTVAEPTALLVAPRWLKLTIPPPQQDPDRTSNAAVPTDELVVDPSGVRQYRTGDPRRLVHWKATARRDTLMVREQVQRRITDVWVVADTVAAVADDAFETGLAVAASLTASMAAAGHRVHLVTTGSGLEANFTPDAGHGPIGRHFALAEVAPQEEPTWAAGIGEALGPRGGQVPVYAVVAHPTPARAGLLGTAVQWGSPAAAWLVGEAAAALAPALAGQGWLVHLVDEAAGV
jgi:uncharacterized protein (DUF58 family)